MQCLSIEPLEPRRLLSLPSGWTDQNIGSPAHLGSASFNTSTGVWTQTGGGADIFNKSDQFNFASEHFSGAATAVVDVTSISNTNAWAKAGVMIRNSAAANDAFADIVITPGHGVSFQWRSALGAAGTSITVAGVTPPRWLKLVRSGNSFTGFYGGDGKTWKQVGTAAVTVP